MVPFWKGAEFGASTVAEILASASRLGVPAFQRGAVWSGDESAVANLLNSLARGYFVGSLLLWVPPMSGRVGSAPVVARGTSEALLVDGQQRVRALLGVLSVPPTGHGRRHWCVGVAADGAAEFRCIRFETSDGETRARHTADKPFVPLALLPSIRRLMPDVDPRALPELAWTAGRSVDLHGHEAQLERLLAARISWRALVGEEWNLRRVIENYSRLNGTGERLRKEELTFARLVDAAGDRVNDALAAVIRGRPSGDWECDASDASELAEHDAQLERGREREFGLALFIRTVGIVRDHDEAKTDGESGLPLTSLPDVSTAIRYVDVTRDVLLALGRAITDLHCDSCHRIPLRGGIDRLVPAIFALVRFPELRDPAAASALQALVLGRLLDARGDETNAEMAARVLRARTAMEALASIWASEAPNAEAMLARVQKATTTGDPMVDMLYWLLRRRGAFDVTYPNGVRGAPIARTLEAKQHIIPFNRAAKDESVRRTSAHVVNSLGNLTYISHEANGLDGWAARFMTFGDDAENAERHLLGGDSPASFTATCARAGRADGSRVIEDDLARFVETRSEHIASAFIDFWSEVYGARLTNVDAARRLAESSAAARAWNLRDHLHRLGFHGARGEGLWAVLRPATRSKSVTWKNGTHAGVGFRLCDRNSCPTDPFAELRYDARCFPLDDFRWETRDVHIRVHAGGITYRVSGDDRDAATTLLIGTPALDTFIGRFHRETTRRAECFVWTDFLRDVTERVGALTPAPHKKMNRHPRIAAALHCEQTLWHLNDHNAILRLQPTPDGEVLAETMLEFHASVDPDAHLARNADRFAAAIEAAGFARPILSDDAEWRKFGNIGHRVAPALLNSPDLRTQLAREMAAYIELVAAG